MRHFDSNKGTWLEIEMLPHIPASDPVYNRSESMTMKIPLHFVFYL
jgi:hypothetical protein